MVTLTLNLPTRETPGFLRRSRDAMKFQARLQSKNFDAGIFDEIVDFLLPFVTDPKDRSAAREALLDASQAQFEQALSAMMGATQGAEEAVPPPNAEG